MNEEEDDDSPPMSNFFSRRAKIVPKVSAEEFKAASKLIEEIKENSNECPLPKKPKPPAVKRRVASKLEGTEEGLNKVTCNGSSKLKSKRQAFSEDILVDPADLVSSDEKSTNQKDDIDADEENELNNSFLSPAAKRRLTILQKKQEKELKSIEAENQKVLSALNTSEANVDVIEVDEEENSIKKISVLTISYLTDISRLKCFEDEKFSTIFPKVAELFKLKATEFLLCLKDKNIQINDTPKSLNIGASDVVECIPYKVDGNSEIEYDENKLKLFFQASDTKVKTEIVAHKLEKMQVIMEQYSKTRNIPLDQLEFEFDGERIGGTETPEDMDMESGSCVDVHVLSSDKPKKQTLEQKSSEATSVVTLESDSNDSDFLYCD